MTHAPELWIVQQQIRELRARLHEIELRHSRDALVEAIDAEHLTHDDARVVEAQRLIEVTDEQKMLASHACAPAARDSCDRDGAGSHVVHTKKKKSPLRPVGRRGDISRPRCSDAINYSTARAGGGRRSRYQSLGTARVTTCFVPAVALDVLPATASLIIARH